MLIYKHGTIPTGLVSIENSGDTSTYRCVEDVTGILQHCQERRHAAMGVHEMYLGDRWEKIATVPMTIFKDHPEFRTDQQAFMKWLRTDEYGRMYRTSGRRI